MISFKDSSYFILAQVYIFFFICCEGHCTPERYPKFLEVLLQYYYISLFCWIPRHTQKKVSKDRGFSYLCLFHICVCLYVSVVQLSSCPLLSLFLSCDFLLISFAVPSDASIFQQYQDIRSYNKEINQQDKLASLTTFLKV